MKSPLRFSVFVLVLSTLLLSACGAVAAPPLNVSGGSDKVQPAPLEFTGPIEAINGNEWTVNGQAMTVDSSIIHDGPFNVGDTVRVEAAVQPDGSIIVTRVELPDSPEVQEAQPAESPEAEATDAPEAVSTHDPATDSLEFDHGGNQAFGTIDSFDGTTIVIGGQTFQLGNGAEVKDQIAAGSFVKVHFVTNADGTLSIVEIEISDPARKEDNSGTSIGDDNSGQISGQSDDGPNHDSNDDRGGGGHSGGGGGGNSGGGGSDDGSGHD